MPNFLNGGALQVDTSEELAAYFWNNPKVEYLKLRNYGADTLPSLPLSLRKLVIEFGPNLVSLPELPASVNYLSVHGCPKLTTLPELNNLERIYLDTLPSLLSLPVIRGVAYRTWLSVTACPGLTNLENLGDNVTDILLTQCHGVKILRNLPRFLTSLCVIECSIEALSLPESIESLSLRDCPEINSFIDLKPTMKYIEFARCPLLKMRIALPPQPPR